MTPSQVRDAEELIILTLNHSRIIPDDIVPILPLVFMIIGIIVLCMGLFGCTGLPMRNKPTAVVFYITANILIFLEIGLGIYWAIMWSNYENHFLKPEFQQAFDEFKTAPEPWTQLHQKVRDLNTGLLNILLISCLLF